MLNNYLGSISEPDRMPLQRVYNLVGEIEKKTLTITTCVRRCPGWGQVQQRMEIWWGESSSFKKDVRMGFIQKGIQGLKMGRRWRETNNVLTRAAVQPEGQAGVVLTKQSVPGMLEEEPEDQCGARATEVKQGDQTFFFFGKN